jgi:dienelactone hydrolase
MVARLAPPILILSFCLSAQVLEVVPNRVLADEIATIRVAGLQPNERATIQAELTDGAEHRWESHAEFVADAQGTIDASRQAPAAGSYKDVSAMGLIWSMMPKDKGVAMYQGQKGQAPQITELQLLRKGDQKPAATVRLEQVFLADGVRKIPLHENDLRGVLYLPATTDPRPGVLVVGGSNGGLPTREAAWLASHGYAALALAYFHYEDLPPLLEAIPLEYFGKALSWMMKRPEIQPEHLAVMGSSRGGELALQLGSMYAPIHAVVAYVPANVRFPSCCGLTHVAYAWTWKGQPLTFVPPRQLNRAAIAIEAAIHVEGTAGPILVISGEDDHIWDSSGMAESVIARLKNAHFTYNFAHLKYPHAGHSAGHPDILPAWHGAIRHPVSGNEIHLGGSPAGDAASSLDAGPKVLEFLRQALSTSAGPVK